MQICGAIKQLHNTTQYIFNLIFIPYVNDIIFMLLCYLYRCITKLHAYYADIHGLVTHSCAKIPVCKQTVICNNIQLQAL